MFYCLGKWLQLSLQNNKYIKYDENFFVKKTYLGVYLKYTKINAYCEYGKHITNVYIFFHLIFLDI